MPRHRHTHESPRMIGHAREMRWSTTHPERVLWDRLRAGRLGGLKFRRQHPIGRYIVDFYCAAAKLVVELDGRSHNERQDEDRIRDAALRVLGCDVLRLTNEELLYGIDKAVAMIGQRASSLIELRSKE